MMQARQLGLAYIPLVVPDPSLDHAAAYVNHAGHLWDLAEWMPGSADFHASPSLSRLRAACIALARLHRVWERFAGPAQPSPAVSRRLIAAREWLVSAPPVPSSPLGQRARNVVDEHISKILHLLEPWRDVDLLVQPCLCDIWHDHVLFTGDDVTGLIDFGAMKLDHVAVDLARLHGSLVGDDREMYEAGLDAYATIRPLSQHERQLARLLDRTGVILGLANWLRHFHDREDFDRSAATARMAELVRRAEAWK